MSGVNSAFLASLQASVGAGDSLEVPAVILPTLSVGLPIQSTPNNVTVDLRRVQASAQCVATINQGASTAVIGSDLCIFDRGIYRVSGMMQAFFAMGAPTAGDPFGAVIQIVNPPATQAQHIGFTPRNDDATLSQQAPTRFGPYTYQFNIPGYILRLSTFHNTGVGQTIGVVCTAFVERLI